MQERQMAQGQQIKKKNGPIFIVDILLRKLGPRRQFWYWSFVAIAAAAVLALIAVNAFPPGDIQPLDVSKNQHVLKNTLPDNYSFTPAADGEYPKDFPQELVLFNKVTVVRGENTDDGTGVNHRIVEYTVAAAPVEAVVRYQTKLQPLGWELLGSYTQGNLNIINLRKSAFSLTVIVAPLSATSSRISLDLKTPIQ